MRFPRRKLLAAGAGAGLAALGRGSAAASGPPEPEISPLEDLMREHAVLERVLLCYEAGIQKIRATQPIGPENFRKAATIVRQFVEDYHEKLEEEHLFPAFEKRKSMLGLVRTLRRQHEVGRMLTDAVLANAADAAFVQADARGKLVTACEEFIRMYRPHMAWEGSVLFPAFHGMFGEHELDVMGERFEAEEHRRFGQHGFEKIVEQVAGIETLLGIHDLELFTPQV